MKTIKGERTAIFHNSFPFIIDLFFLCLHNHELIWKCFLSAIGSNVFTRPFYRILFFLLLPTVQLCLNILFRLLFRIFLLFCCSTNKTMGDFIWFYIFAIFLTTFLSKKTFFKTEVRRTRWIIENA